MGHLVKDGVGTRQPGRLGDPRTEDVAFAERDAAGVLHRTEVELGHEELVVLAERVGHVELLGEPVEALTGQLDDLVGVEVLGHGLPAVDPELDIAVAGVHAVVGTGHERGDVGGDRLGRLEGPAAGLALLGPRGHPGVGHDLPPGRRAGRHGDGRLDVRLVEAGVDAVGVLWLELGVEEHLLVDGVHETVHPDTGSAVDALCGDLDHVVLVEAHERDAPVGVVVLELGAVEDNGVHPAGSQVEEGLGGRIEGVEGDADRGGEGLVLGPGQVEVDLVGHVPDQGGAGGGFVPGQV